MLSYQCISSLHLSSAGELTWGGRGWMKWWGEGYSVELTRYGESIESGFDSPHYLRPLGPCSRALKGL